MRTLIATALLMGGLASWPLGALAQEPFRCPDPGCPGEPPLRLGTATDGGVPLVWSTDRGRLVPPPVRHEAVLLGRSIPLDEIIGRNIRPIGRPPEPVIYNKPLADLDPHDPSLMLISLGPRAHPTILRRAD